MSISDFFLIVVSLVSVGMFGAIVKAKLNFKKALKEWQDVSNVLNEAMVDETISTKEAAKISKEITEAILATNDLFDAIRDVTSVVARIMKRR